MNSAVHMITGSAVAIAIKQPVLAIPLAFASHFALDTLPHFGYDRAGYGVLKKHKSTLLVAVMDIILWVITIWLIWGKVWWVFIAGLVAVSPDFAWPYRYLKFERHGQKTPRMPISDWHSRIQWLEKPKFIVFEIAWFIVMAGLVAHN